MKVTSKTTIEQLFYEDSMMNITVKKSEQENLDRVFEILYELENEPSSDEDQFTKQYLKMIYSKAEQKRAINIGVNKNKSSSDKPTIKSKKEYSEDKSNSKERTLNKKFGQKALRKIIRKYLPPNSELPKDDIRLMVWVTIFISGKR